MIKVLQEHKQLKITELRANKGQLVDRGIPTNPRKITKEKYNLLLQSLDKSNLTQIRPLDVIEHEGKYIVLSGNQRLRALKELKVKEVPCNILRDDLEPETYRQIVLQANTNYGEHDDDLLANEWDAVELHEWGYDLPDWETEKIEEETQGDDEVPESAPAITVKGDLYQLGEHRLLCGDSTMIDDVEKLMDGEKADMVFTDPPYGVSYKGINNDDRGGLENLLNGAFSCMMSVSQKGASVYCFHSDKCADIFNNIFRKFCHFSSMIIWVKPSLVLSQTDYQSKHEPCLYGWFNNGTHNFMGDRKQTSVWEFGKESVNGHTTPKPVELVLNSIKNSSKSKDIICDPFLGSGSTLIACEKTNRKCYGMELDEKYCDVIVKRYIEFCVKNNKDAKVYRNGELISNDVFLVG